MRLARERRGRRLAPALVLVVLCAALACPLQATRSAAEDELHSNGAEDAPAREDAVEAPEPVRDAEAQTQAVGTDEAERFDDWGDDEEEDDEDFQGDDNEAAESDGGDDDEAAESDGGDDDEAAESDGGNQYPDNSGDSQPNQSDFGYWPDGEGSPPMPAETVAGEEQTSDVAGEESSWEQLADEYADEAEQVMLTDRDSPRALRLFRLAAIYGHSGAMTTIGALLASGDVGVPRDLQKAVRFFRLAASKGQPDAHASLAFLHASGVADRYGVAKSEAKAILHWTIAAQAGSVQAQMALGYRHLHGISVPKSCPAAARYYERAAHSVAEDARNVPSLERFFTSRPPLPTGLTSDVPARLSEDALNKGRATAPEAGDNEVVDYHRHLAARGNADSLVTMGGLQLFGGHGIDADENLAVPHLERAAELGNGEADGMLAHLALNKKQNFTALHRFRRSASVGNAIGLYGMGMMYLHGIAVESDFTKAGEYFRDAAEKQHADAAYHLGAMYWRGQGVQKSAADAYRYFQQASRLGQMQARLNLGLMTLEGHDPVTEPDCERGVALLKKVSEGGEWNTLLTLGSDEVSSGNMFGALYRSLQGAHVGIEVAQYNAALILERSAKLARSKAANSVQFEHSSVSRNAPYLSPPRFPVDGVAGLLGELEAESFSPSSPLHESDEGGHWSVERMYEGALALYEQSFRQGYASSVLRAGHVAYSDIRDYRRAAAAYAAGARARCSECAFSLGVMHFHGLGVDQDRAATVRYLKQAGKFSTEGRAPATVALVGAKVAWWCADNFWGNASDVLKGLHGITFSGAAVDAMVVGALTALLVAVVLARRRRMLQESVAVARESGGEQEYGRLNGEIGIEQRVER